MKTIKVRMFLLILLNLCSSCENRQRGGSSYASPLMVTAKMEEGVEKSERIQFDELFDDFIYHFALDAELQKQRILFPLPYSDLTTESRIERTEWQHDSLYAGEGFYSLFFDREDDMELPKDTSLTSVQVEWIAPESHTIKKYCFKRIERTWCLEAIQVSACEEGEGESFTDFFFRFSNDSAFQQTRIKSLLTFVTNDPDDDFTIITTTLGLNQWAVFKPELPANKISNIDYGQQNNNSSNKKVVALKGIGNGFSSTLYFQRKERQWELYKFEDISN